MKTLLQGLALVAVVLLILLGSAFGLVNGTLAYGAIAVIIVVSLVVDMRRQAKRKREREARMDALRRRRQNTPD